MKLAPIGLTVYTRLEHLKKAIHSLKSNILAKKSKLYIFSDGHRSGDELKVQSMRKFLYTINGFKKISIIERKENSRIQNNRGGQKYLLEKYGKMIWIAEDIITAPSFLKFINDALNVYQDDKQILSITGYSPPIYAEKYCHEDIFILPRFNAWGLGIWKDRYDKISKISKKEFKSFMFDKEAVKNFIHGGGEDMLPMLKKDISGEIDALDVRAMFCQYKNKQFTIYPKKSLTQNIGHDGTGIHCGVSNKFDVDLWDKVDKFEFIKDIQPDDRIIKANRKFRSAGVKGKIAKMAKKIGIYQTLKYCKDKISE